MPAQPQQVVRRCALLLGVQVRGDQQHPAAQGEVRQEIAILRACRDVNIVQFVVRRAGQRAGLLSAPGWHAAPTWTECRQLLPATAVNHHFSSKACQQVGAFALCPFLT